MCVKVCTDFRMPIGVVWLIIVQDIKSDAATALRPLDLDDFIQSKAKVKI